MGCRCLVISERSCGVEGLGIRGPGWKKRRGQNVAGYLKGLLLWTFLGLLWVLLGNEWHWYICL
jgi:hypothetical protein